MFEEFFARADAFALGVCNGCQMLAALKELIPGRRRGRNSCANRSDQFEARLTLVEIVPSPSVLLAGMEGSRIPIVTAHGARPSHSLPAWIWRVKQRTLR